MKQEVVVLWHLTFMLKWQVDTFLFFCFIPLFLRAVDVTFLYQYGSHGPERNQFSYFYLFAKVSNW